MQYGRPESPIWSTAPESPTEMPTEQPAAPVNVLDSHPGMLEDIRLEKLDPLPGSEEKEKDA